MKQPDMDMQTQAFIRQLKVRDTIELNLLTERVHSVTDGADAIRPMLDKRVVALKKLQETERDVDLVPIGVGRIVPGRYDLIPPFGTPITGIRPMAVCNLDQTLDLDQTSYLVLYSNTEYSEQSRPPKSAVVHAAANPWFWDTYGTAQVGYKTQISVPAAQGATTVRITSQLSTSFSWVEANAVGANWFAQVSAIAWLWMTYGTQLQLAPRIPLIKFTASGGQVFSHSDMPTTSPGAVIESVISVPPGSGTTINVFESIGLAAITPNGHAYISGSFTWSPLRVQMQEGCRFAKVPNYGLWGEV